MNDPFSKCFIFNSFNVYVIIALFFVFTVPKREDHNISSLFEVNFVYTLEDFEFLKTF